VGGLICAEAPAAVMSRMKPRAIVTKVFNAYLLTVAVMLRIVQRSDSQQQWGSSRARNDNCQKKRRVEGLEDEQKPVLRKQGQLLLCRFGLHRLEPLVAIHRQLKLCRIGGRRKHLQRHPTLHRHSAKMLIPRPNPGIPLELAQG